MKQSICRRRLVSSILFACGSILGAIHASTPDLEQQTLTTFFSELGGASWNVNRGWNHLLNSSNSSDPCIRPTWHGVDCAMMADNVTHIVGLSLSSNNLQGVLPNLQGLQYLVNFDVSSTSPGSVNLGTRNIVLGSLGALCNLPSLETALLPYNSVAGSLPQCLSSLSNLKTLDLDYNPVNGITPDSICALSKLENLQLRGCQLTGSIPSCIGNLASLRLLDYTSITLEGFVPGVQSISGSLPHGLCELRSLEQLFLQQTQGIVGSIPDCFGLDQPSLSSFDIQGNKIEGSIPESLCSAKELTSLCLYENSIQSSIPECIGNLDKLQKFEVQNNEISGQIPLSLCNATHLAYLVLYGNSALSGPINDCLGHNPFLSILELAYTSLSGTIPESLCQLKYLRVLYFSNMNLVGTIPSCLGGSNNLQLLELSNNNIEGQIPESFCALQTLSMLSVDKNRIEGTLPHCLGNMSSLTDFEIQFNPGIISTIPETMCHLSNLVYLYMHDTSLDGNIPPCFGTDFPNLKVLLLHNNRLSGRLLQEWRLPSLGSIVLSNNKELRGNLPASIFHQQGGVAESSLPVPNPTLLSVVIEGTRVHGTINGVCFVPQLEILGISGNEISGSIPRCMANLHQLKTLRACCNEIGGTLPNLGNLTSLSYLDLSSNKLQGSLDSSLGDMSSQLETTKLSLNQISCALPSSIRHWAQATNMSNLDILHGNLFSCGGDSLFSRVFALSIVDADGLEDANSIAFNSYSCGRSSDVLPISSLAVAIPMLCLLIWSGIYSRRVSGESPLIAHPSLQHVSAMNFASAEVANLCAGVLLSCMTGSLLMFIMLCTVATSQFDCEYSTAVSLANKDGQNSDLSVSVGISVVFGLICGLSPWWRRIFSSITNEATSLRQHDEERLDSSIQLPGDGAMSHLPSNSRHARAIRAAKLLVLAITMSVLGVGPNVAYVSVALSKSISYKLKVFSMLGITSMKVLLTTLVIPLVSRLSVNEIFPAAHPNSRFKLRIVISTILAALTTVFAPAIVVLLTDQRCAYYFLFPQGTESTEIDINYCSDYDTQTDFCRSYGTTSVESSYRPPFQYSGDTCLSALLDTYDSIFLTAVLFLALVPATTEIIIVRVFASWCYTNIETSRFARFVLKFLRVVTWNVTPTLVEAGYIPFPEISRVNYQLQRVVERSFIQLISTLLISLTFGLAAPVVGVACAVASLVQYYHHCCVVGHFVSAALISEHRELLSAVSDVEKVDGHQSVARSALYPPFPCAVVVVVTVLVFWSGGSFRFLEVSVVGVAALVTWIGFLLGIALVFFRKFRETATQLLLQEEDVRQTASFSSLLSDSSSPGLLLEPLLDERDEVGRNDVSTCDEVNDDKEEEEGDDGSDGDSSGGDRLGTEGVPEGNVVSISDETD